MEVLCLLYKSATFSRLTDMILSYRISLCQSVLYLSANFIVVKVHERPGIVCHLASVEEESRESESILDVGAAAAPPPSLVGDARLFASVAAAVGEVALHTCLGDGVCDAGRRDRFAEGRLAISCPGIGLQK